MKKVVEEFEQFFSCKKNETRQLYILYIIMRMVNKWFLILRRGQAARSCVHLKIIMINVPTPEIFH